MAVTQKIDTYKIITVGQFLKALEDNGYKRADGDFIVRDDAGKILSACAIGQAALNLGVDPQSLVNGLSNLIADPADKERQDAGQFIFDKNDEKHQSPKQIAAMLRRRKLVERYPNMVLKARTVDYSKTPGYKGAKV